MIKIVVVKDSYKNTVPGRRGVLSTFCRAALDVSQDLGFEEQNAADGSFGEVRRRCSMSVWR